MNDVLGYQPLDWQVAPFRDKSQVMLLTGAAGGGKSRVAAEKIHAYLLRYPEATGIVGRKDKTAANKSVVPFLRYTVQGETDWGVFKKADSLFQYHNGSQLWVVGTRDEGQRENLKSIGKTGSVDIAWFEEANALSIDDHNLIISRMRGTAAGWRQIIYSTNPDRPDHFINKILIEGGKAKVFYSRPEDNPFNAPDYIENLKSMTGVYYQRLYLGLWVQAEGAVYTEYDPEVHLLDWVERNKDDRYMVSIDFGYTNPFTCTLWHITDDGIIELYKQIYHTKRTIDEHVPDIKKMIEGVNVEAWICDHDAENRANLEKKLDITTTAAYKSVEPGINAVKQRLKDARIRFMREAVQRIDEELDRRKEPTCTIEEISGYRWSDKKQDTPIKERDHGLDDLRYLIAYVDKIAEETIEINPRASVINYLSDPKDKKKDGPYSPMRR